LNEKENNTELENRPLPVRVKPIPMAIDPDKLLKEINKINKSDYRNRWDLAVFTSFMYLTGARVTEAINVKRKHLEIRNNNLFVVNLKTLKSRVYPIRQLPIAPVKTDKPFFEILSTYLEENSFQEDDFLFPFQSRFKVFYRLRKIMIPKLLQLDPNKKAWIEEDFHLHPHYLRHCRLSHLASIFDFNEIQLMKFAGWSSTKPTIFYIKLSYSDILKKMIQPSVVSEYFEQFLGG